MAKKRSLLIVLSVVALSGLFLAAFAAQGSRRLATAKTELVQCLGSLDPSALSPPPVAEYENAGRLFERALEHSPTLEDSQPALQILSQLAHDIRTPLTDEQRYLVHELIGRFAEPLSLARRSAQARNSNFGIDYAQGADAELPDFLALVQLSKILLAEARLAWDEGNFVLGESNLAALHSLRQALAREPVLISQLIALTVDRHFLEAVQLALEHAIDHPSGLELAQRLLLERESVETLRSGLEGEAIMAANWSETTTARRSIRERLSSRRVAAAMIEDYLLWLKRRDLDGPELLAEIELRRASQTKLAAKGPLFVSFPELLLEGLEVEAASQLAARAIELERERAMNGSYPLDPVFNTERYSGKSPVVESRNGRLELISVEAENLWSRIHAESSGKNSARFRWRLASPDDPSLAG